MLEMLKSPAIDLWSLPWIKAAPQVEAMLMGIAAQSGNDPRFADRGRAES
jgi:hypothetical protein